MPHDKTCLMIKNDGEFQQTLEQLGRMYRALAELRRDVLPKNRPYVRRTRRRPARLHRQFLDELEQSRLSLLAEPHVPGPSRRVG
jgi:hypothetical protein